MPLHNWLRPWCASSRIPPIWPGYPDSLPNSITDPISFTPIEEKYIAPIRATYVALIERGKAEGIVRGEVDGGALLDTVRGAVMLHTLINTALGETALIDHLRSIILHGITIGG